LEFLEEQELPYKLDDSAFPPGVKRSTIDQVRQSLRQLGLIDSNWKPTAQLGVLLRSSGDEEQRVWTKILEQTYGECFRIGWLRLTPLQLSNFLEERGAVYETRDRAARFIRKALEYAAIEHSEALDRHWNASKRQWPSPQPARRSLSVKLQSGIPLDLGRVSVTIGQPPSDADLDLLEEAVRAEQSWRRQKRA
jgi:hypothetical protein